MKEKLWNNRILILKAFLLGLLPLLCCVVSTAMEGYSLKDVYLPSCDWNDELFYFKQVEGMLSHGYPYGYFGFNESHALKLSFAAWSPLLVWPWLLFGAIFGWSLSAPIAYNILFMSIAMIVFVCMTKPKWKQVGILAILVSVFVPFTRYMLSGMPEIICFSMLIIYLAFMISYLEKESVGKLVGLFVLSVTMTLMRPYLILFLLFPMWAWIRSSKKKGMIGSTVVLLFTAISYYFIKHYFGAEYFTPLFKTEWIEPFFRGEILGGVKGIVYKLYSEGMTFARLTIQGLISGFTEGAFFAGYLALLVLAFFYGLGIWKKGNKKQGGMYLYIAFCFFAMLMALLLMYKMKEGSKHLLTFMAMGIFALAMMETRFFKKAMFFSALCVYLYTVKGTSPMDYQVPYATEAREEQMAYWQRVFEEELVLSEENVPNYENVVIWVFDDALVDNKNVRKMTDWQILYMLPEGFGISCCYADFIEANFDSLKSQYITIPVGGEIQEMCEAAGKELVGADESVCVYRLH